jgi:DNA-binding NtrC family response regulator
VKGLFVTRNRKAGELARALQRFAGSDLSLILEGETGVGKSFVVARAHRVGRSGRPIVVVDCGAIPATLIPSALFGHRAGAFTDATRHRTGLLERADDGTLVLDHVEALPPEGQTSLLRVLEERAFLPVGTAAPRPFRARVIALAGADLRERVAAGEFRPDLYHRLAGFHATLPALRHRSEDVLPFATAFLRRAARKRSMAFALDPDAEKLLLAYPWPGNFRELETVLIRTVVQADSGTVRPGDLGLPAGAWPQVMEMAAERAAPLAEIQRIYAVWVLGLEGGNVSRAARILGVSRRTLIRWRRDS